MHIIIWCKTRFFAIVFFFLFFQKSCGSVKVDFVIKQIYFLNLIFSHENFFQKIGVHKSVTQDPWNI